MAVRYKRQQSSTVILMILDSGDVVSVAPDPNNLLYQDYLAWVNAGNTVEPADPPDVNYNDSLLLRGRLRTTNATATELFRRTLRPTTLYRVSFSVLGVDAGNGTVRLTERRATIKRAGAGAVLVGATTIFDHQDVGAATWVIAPSVVGNDVVISVTGAAGRTIDWLLDGDAVSFTPGGF